MIQWQNTAHENWSVLRFMSTHGIDAFIQGGIHYHHFTDEADGLAAITEIEKWLADQDEFEWCAALKLSRETYIKRRKHERTNNI